jgi:hypothetical protein
LLLFTLAAVTTGNGCWCKDCASLKISLPQPDAQADDGLVVAVSRGKASALASCTWARTSSGPQPSGSWTCTHDGQTTTAQGMVDLYFDVENAGGTCTFTITDSLGSRSLKREPEDVSSGEASMAGCACDERGVKVTPADLAPPTG